MRIAIIGHFGGKHNFNDGQTIKTKTLYSAFKRRGFSKIDRVDTYYIKNNPFRFIAELVKSVFLDRYLLVLVSENGRKFLFPVLYVLSKYFHKKVFHYAIAGNLLNEAKANNHTKKYITNFQANWMESKVLAEELRNIGVKNASYLPNFKNVDLLDADSLNMSFSKPYSFCVFSRIMEEKGVTDAIAVIENINCSSQEELATLDIYGPVDESYKSEFKELLSKSKHCKYCGVVDADKSVSYIKDYYALLFPTKFRYEGIPGTIIDALSAGLPVIASRWQYCDEMLEDGQTGYVYDFGDVEKMQKKILYAIAHQDETIGMKKNCLNAAIQYNEKYVMHSVLEQMGLTN